MSGKQAVIETTGRAHRHRPAAGQGAEPRRLLHQAGPGRRLRRHDVPPADQARHHPGRRPAVEGPGQGGPVRHRRPEDAGVRARGRRHVRGAVSSVLVPGNRDSAGAQFFICVTPQAGARRAVHRLRPRRRGHRRRDADLRGAGRRGRQGHGADRDDVGHDPRRASGGRRALLDGVPGGAGPVPRGARNEPRQHHDRVPARQGAEPRAQLPAPGRPRACTTAWRSTASCPGS